MTINGTDNIVSKLSNQFALPFDSGGNKKETAVKYFLGDSFFLDNLLTNIEKRILENNIKIHI